MLPSALFVKGTHQTKTCCSGATDMKSSPAIANAFMNSGVDETSRLRKKRSRYCSLRKRGHCLLTRRTRTLRTKIRLSSVRRQERESTSFFESEVFGLRMTKAFLRTPFRLVYLHFTLGKKRAKGKEQEEGKALTPSFERAASLVAAPSPLEDRLPSSLSLP